VRWPGPGQYRGDGEWKRIREVKVTPEEWENFKATGYLPTHEGDEPPAEA
jgi:hypothetical protein